MRVLVATVALIFAIIAGAYADGCASNPSICKCPIGRSQCGN